MGLFLNVMIVPGKRQWAVAWALKQLSAGNREWRLLPKQCRYLSRKQGVMVLLNEEYSGFDGVARRCSEQLKCPVLLSYIYDGEFWGYFMFDWGREVDRFSAMPDYLEELTPQEMQRFAGRSDVIARYFGVAPERISGYLRFWPEELFEGAVESCAYEDDEFGIGTDWQMADFLKAIGWPYEW